MRALVLTIGALIVILALSSLYRWVNPTILLSPLPSNLKLLGVIDMDASHDFSIKSVAKGNDILLVLDENNFVNEFIPAHPELSSYYSKPFDIMYYDNNHDGEIDSQEPIWGYLYIVIYSDNGATYQVRPLNDAGIHAILARHLTPKGNHEVLLTDGDTRILYEEFPSLSRS
ncbi:MAG: hypothetical protein H0U71_00500 [Gammaproteobacteria bacterium]|nr:hypothetical protein [Gammaproteobacteria bacterium]